MKKIIFFPILILIAAISSVWANTRSNLTNTDSYDILQHTLPESIYCSLKNKQIIFYSFGHYGYSWSLIAKIDSTYHAYSGRIDYSGKVVLNHSSESMPFDTTKLFNHNEALLSWGFDTIATEAIKMKGLIRTPYIPLRADLVVFNSEGTIIFNSEDATAFAGKDSVNFNKKFQKLCLIMRWLSDARIREYIPPSAIY